MSWWNPFRSRRRVAPCPADASLIDVLVARADDRTAAAILDHLEGCDRCRERARRLELELGDDSLLEGLRAGGSSRFGTEEGLRLAMLGLRVVEKDYLIGVDRCDGFGASAAGSMPDAARLDDRASSDGPSAARDPIGSPSPSTAEPFGNLPFRARDYLLMNRIGSGGAGTVYLALHTKLRRRVAVKLLRGNGGTTSSRLLADEAEAAGSVDHPSIVRVTDALVEAGHRLLVMEYVDGWNFSQVVSRYGPLSVSDALLVVSQVALGMDFAHLQGLIHRDLKPSNLMLARDGSVRILDLGLARSRRRGATRDSRWGTPGTLGYAAPEQLADADASDQRSDVYSLGGTFFRLITGRIPMATALGGGADDDELREAELRLHRRQLPEGIVEFYRRMTATDPNRRYDDMLQVVAEAERLRSAADSRAPWSVEGDEAKEIAEALGRLRRRCGVEAERGLRGESRGDERLDERLEEQLRSARSDSRRWIASRLAPARGDALGRMRRWGAIGGSAALVAALLLIAPRLVPWPRLAPPPGHLARSTFDESRSTNGERRGRADSPASESDAAAAVVRPLPERSSIALDRLPVNDLLWAEGPIDRILACSDHLIVGFPVDERGGPLLWPTDRKLEMAFSMPVPTASGEAIRAIAHDPTHDELLLVDRSGVIVRYGNEARRLEMLRPSELRGLLVRSLANGDRLIVVTAGELLLTDRSGEQVIARVPLAGTVIDARTSLDGAWLALRTGDRGGVRLVRIDADRLVPLGEIPDATLDPHECFGFAPDRAELLLGFGRLLRRYPLEKLVGTNRSDSDGPSSVPSNADSPGATDASVTTLESAFESELVRLEDGETDPLGSVASACAFCRTRPWIAFATGEGNLEVWDYRRRERLAKIFAGFGPVDHLAFDDAGNRLAIVEKNRLSVRDVAARDR